MPQKTTLFQNATTFLSQELTKMQAFYKKDNHSLIIHDPQSSGQSNKIPSCKRIDFNPTFKTQNLVAIGRDDSNDIKIPNSYISRQHVELVRKRFINLYWRSVSKTKNKTWRLIWGLIPVRVDGKEFLLHHGDTYILGNPLMIFSFWRWSVGSSVKIKYLNPIPFPFSFFRFAKTVVIRSAKVIGALFTLALLWMLLNWSNIPGKVLPAFEGAPVVIFASDNTTSLKPLPAKRPDFVQDLKSFGQYLPDAVVASEDRRFRLHPGVDPIGLLKAVLSVFSDSPRGGSTLQQQLARTLYPDWVGRTQEYQLAGSWLGKPATIWRKLREFPVALKLNFAHSKDDILLTYLNAAPLGHEKYGFVEAAQYYFQKPVDKLSLAEVATLVAMLPEPNNFINAGLCSPQGSGYLNKLSDRRRRVIDWMAKNKTVENPGLIRRAKLTSVTNLFAYDVCNPAQQDFLIPRIYDSPIYRELYNLMQQEYWQGNLVVETTIDPPKQREARQQMTTFVKTTGKAGGLSQGGLVSIDPTTGGIVALVEAVEPQQDMFSYIPSEQKNKKDPERILTQDRAVCEDNENCIQLAYNFATNEALPPGSTFKVFAYAAALEQGISSNQIYDCSRFTFKHPDPKKAETYQAAQWKDSYCDSEKGSLDLLTAMGTSDNLTALKVAQDAGLDNTIELAQRLGITSDLLDSPRLILGNSPVKLLEMTSAYGVFANRGYKRRPHVIDRIIDLSSPKCTYENYRNNSECLVLYAHDGDPAAGLRADTRGNKQVLAEDIADKMTILMQGTVSDGRNGRSPGTARNVDIRDAAGKTGTADKRSDLWFVGYVPNELVTGIWLGNPLFEHRNREGRKPTNITSSQAAQIWQDYMQNLGY